MLRCCFALSALAVVLPCCTGPEGPPPDSGSGDAGRADAGPADAGATQPDAGLPDAGAPDAGAPDAGTAPPPAIVITMTPVPSEGHPALTAQVSVGGGPPFTALVDTGSVGLRVLNGTVPASAWSMTSTPANVTYGSGLVATGVVANAVVSVGGVATSGPIPIVAVTAVGCTAAAPNCPGAGQTVPGFLFRGMFPAVLGVGLRKNAANGIESPLIHLGQSRQYVMSVPPAGGSTGTLQLDPPPTERARFSSNVVQLATLGTGWDDTNVPFCINSFCAGALLDTGGNGTLVITDSSDYAALGVPDGSMLLPPGTTVTASINTASTWSFTVGATPAVGVDHFALVSSGRNNLAITPFHQFDVFYDCALGQIGLAPK
jgi:hypothetical protein